MKKAIKSKWVAALKSGKYEQGTGYLNKDGKFCCLGVLCDIYSKEKNIPWTKAADPKETALVMDDGIATLPKSVMEWSGLEDDCGRIGDLSLVTMNDSNRDDFKEIAKVIAKQL